MKEKHLAADGRLNADEPLFLIGVDRRPSAAKISSQLFTAAVRRVVVQYKAASREFRTFHEFAGLSPGSQVTSARRLQSTEAVPRTTPGPDARAGRQVPGSFRGIHVAA